MTEHGSMSGETNMMSALQDGPIACGMCVTDEFEAYEGFGIFEDTSGCTEQEHAISIVGYGTDSSSGTDYWIGYVVSFVYLFICLFLLNVFVIRECHCCARVVFRGCVAC